MSGVSELRIHFLTIQVKISKLVSSKTAWGNFAAHKYSTAAAGDAKPAAQAPMSKAEKERARVEMARKNITPAKPKLDQGTRPCLAATDPTRSALFLAAAWAVIFLRFMQSFKF